MSEEFSEEQLEELGTCSKTKNKFGVDIKTARKVSIGGSVIAGLVFLFGLTTPMSVGVFLVMLFAAASWGLFWYFAQSEYDIKETNLKAKNEYDVGLNASLNRNEKSVCRKCFEQVNTNVKRCPHCGYGPKKRGVLYWSATGLLSLSPAGPILTAKGLNDNRKAGKGVSKTVENNDSDNSELTSQDEHKVSADPTELLESLHELREKDIISEDEFEAKKEDLLNQI